MKDFVSVLDKTPPSISCPARLIVTPQDIDTERSEFTYLRYEKAQRDIRASDNSGNVTLIFDPPQGTKVKTSEVIYVTVTAIDPSQNSAKCSFFIKVEGTL